VMGGASCRGGPGAPFVHCDIFLAVFLV